MQRSSQSIASLAAALAKAQIELSNPEKSLIGSSPLKPNIPTRRSGAIPVCLARKRSRYRAQDARPALTFATVQTTALDQAAGIVNLQRSAPAHASGEWIASDWPVCSISEICSSASDGRGAVLCPALCLVHARSGIAGEDDLVMRRISSHLRLRRSHQARNVPGDPRRPMAGSMHDATAGSSSHARRAAAEDLAGSRCRRARYPAFGPAARSDDCRTQPTWQQ